MDEEVLENGKKLRIVARHGAGYDNLDVKAAKRGIITTYSPDTTALSVAETTITLLLMLAEESETNGNRIEERQFFLTSFSHKGMDVSGKHLELSVLEKSGKWLQKKAAIGLDMKVISYILRLEGKRNSGICKGSTFRAVLKRIRFYQPSCAGRR